MTGNVKEMFRLRETDVFSRSKLIQMYIPILLEQLLLAMLSAADTLMASYLNDAATAGVSYVITITNWVNAFFSGLASGASVLTSQYIGGKRSAHASASVRMSLFSNGTISLLFCSLLMINRAGFLKLVLGEIDPMALPYSVDYFTFMIPAYFFRSIVFVCTATLRSQGNTRLSMILTVSMMTMALGLKLFFSYVLDLGVTGFSLATMISAATAAVVGILLLEFGKGNLRVFSHRHGARFINFPVALRGLGTGMPVAVDSAMFHTGVLLLARLMVTYGVVHGAAQGTAGQLAPLVHVAGTCWGLVGLVTISRSIGMDDKEQAKRYYRLMLLLSISTQVICSTVVFLTVDRLVLIFGGSEEVHTLAAKLLRIYCLFSVPFYPLSFAQPQLLRGAGDTRFTMWVSIGAMFLVRVGLGYILGTVCGLGVVGLYIAMGINWVVRAVLFTGRYFSGKWMNKKVY